MSNTQSSGKSDVKWTDIVATTAALVAIVLSIWSLSQSSKSNRTAEESNEIARTALAHTVTQGAQQSTAKIEIKYYLAESPDLLSGQDAQWISRRQLVPLFVQSQFWLTERSQHKDNLQKRYLFIFVINHGPGRLEGARISDINWNPKEDQQVPMGLAVDGSLSILPSGAFYALLVDVLNSPDPVDYLDSTHFETQTFELMIDIKDELGHEVKLRVPWDDIGAFEFQVP